MTATGRRSRRGSRRGSGWLLVLGPDLLGRGRRAAVGAEETRGTKFDLIDWRFIGLSWSESGRAGFLRRDGSIIDGEDLLKPFLTADAVHNLGNVKREGFVGLS